MKEGMFVALCTALAPVFLALSSKMKVPPGENPDARQYLLYGPFRWGAIIAGIGMILYVVKDFLIWVTGS